MGSGRLETVCDRFRPATVSQPPDHTPASATARFSGSLKQRLARWLLMMRDRGDDDALPITQDLLAEMLGVQRPTASHDTGSAGPHEGIL